MFTPQQSSLKHHQLGNKASSLTNRLRMKHRVELLVIPLIENQNTECFYYYCKFNLSSRLCLYEKIFIFICVLLVVLFFFWQILTSYIIEELNISNPCSEVLKTEPLKLSVLYSIIAEYEGNQISIQKFSNTGYVKKKISYSQKNSLKWSSSNNQLWKTSIVPRN